MRGKCVGVSINARSFLRLASTRFLEQKSKLEHGDFIAWVEANYEFSIETAQVYMRAVLSEQAGESQNLPIAGSLSSACETERLKGK
jgi:hypothetical protein